jgi:type IV pilus assembly protein PilO
MNAMTLTPRTELLIGAAIIVVVALAVVAVLIVPQFGVLADQDAQLAKAQQDVTSAQAVLAQRQSAKNQAAQTQTELMALQNQVPDSPEMPTLIIEMQDIADDAGLAWSKIEPKMPENRDGYSAVPIAVSLSGSWPDAVDYVRRLSRLDRQVRIVSVGLKPLNDPNQQQAAVADGESATSGSTNPSSGPVPLAATIKVEAYVMGAITNTGKPATGASPSGTSQ